MLEAVQKGILSGDFRLEREGEPIADLDVSTWGTRAGVRVDGVDYEMRREGLLSGDFVLEANGQTLARAEKPSALRSVFELSLGPRRYTMKKRSFFSSGFALLDGGRELGSLHRRGLLQRRVEIRLPDDWPVAAQVFVFWLAHIIWSREDAAAAST